jgi:hypothetical protein
LPSNTNLATNSSSYSNTLLVALNARHTDADGDAPVVVSSRTTGVNAGSNGLFSRSLRTLSFAPNFRVGQTTTTGSFTTDPLRSGGRVAGADSQDEIVQVKDSGKQSQASDEVN